MSTRSAGERALRHDVESQPGEGRLPGGKGRGTGSPRSRDHGRQLLVLACVMNCAAADHVLDDIAPELPGKLLVQFTTRFPQDALASETWAHEHRAEYLDYAITGSPAVTFRCCASWIERKGRPGSDSAELLAMDRDQNPVRRTDFEFLISPNAKGVIQQKDHPPGLPGAAGSRGRKLIWSRASLARFSRQISPTLRTQQL